MSGIKKSSGNGTTHRIREQLNFKDNKKWKKFSGRRLELIDKFRLSERKASEQDENIRQIATILRTEFGYPVSSSSEFEKLVTAAVQSVRRNRKRCTKTRGDGFEKRCSANGSSGYGSSGSEVEENISRGQSPVVMNGGRSNGVTSSVGAGLRPMLSSTSLPVLCPEPVRMILNGSSESCLSSTSEDVVNSVTGDDSAVRNIISDLIHNLVSLHEQLRHESFVPLADFAVFPQKHSPSLPLASCSNNLQSPGGLTQQAPLASASQQQQKACEDEDYIPFFLKEKILTHIQRSKTCLELIDSQRPLEKSTSLIMLGETCVGSAICFVMERFFSTLSNSSLEYIKIKVTSQEQIASVCTKLFSAVTKVKMSNLMLESKTMLLQLLVGSIVKDFGFDPCLYQLAEIFYYVIMGKYPLVCGSAPSSTTSIFATGAPMNPQVASKDMHRKVQIRFKDKKQQFSFPLLSNSSPTVDEVLESSRQLFQIASTSSRLVLFHKDRIISDDAELAAIMNQFTSEETLLEVRDHQSINTATSSRSDESDINGLNILSSVSTKISRSPSSLASSTPNSFSNFSNLSLSTFLSNYTHNNRSSVAALDNIISRILSPIAVKTQSAAGEIKSPPIIRPKSPLSPGNTVKDSFERGLPQPIFQPLL